MPNIKLISNKNDKSEPVLQFYLRCIVFKRTILILIPYHRTTMKINKQTKTSISIHN